MYRIAFFDAKPYDRVHFEKFGQEFGIEYRFLETKCNEDTLSLARGFDGVCTFVNDQITPGVIDGLFQMGISVLALRCAGFNQVDMKYAFGRLHVLRVPAYSPYAVAEHTAALLLALNRHIHKSYIRSRDFNFSLSGLEGFDLNGKTVGVLGTGRIGRVFARICLGFSMKVLAYDVVESEEVKKEGVVYTDLDTLLSQSDILSLHLPLTDESYHMINEKSLSKCKDGVILLNTSRGALVNSEDLVRALKTGKVGGAALDVYEEEADLFFEDHSDKVVEDDVLARLVSMPNVIVTSHQAFLTREALSHIAETTSENLISFFEKGQCENEICYRSGKTEDLCRGKCF